MAKPKKPRKRDILLWAVIIAVVLVAVFAVAELVEHIPRRRGEDPRSTAQTEAAESDPLTDELNLSADSPPIGAIPAGEMESAGSFTGKYNANIKNILVLGIDKQELGENDSYRTGGQCDVVMIVSMNLKDKTYFILDLNRDLAVPIEAFDTDGSSYGVVNEQIALSYAYGDGGIASGRNVIRTLNWLLSDDIDFLGYIAAPIPIIGKLADAVGGVEVTIEDDFEGVDDTLKMGETVNLTGSHAETFVRARMTMKESNTNSLRMNRQIQFMESFMNKVKTTMTANELVDLYSDTLDICMTNMGRADIAKWIVNSYNYEFTGFHRIDGVEGEKIYDARCTYEDPEVIHQLVQELYYQ